MMCAKWVDMRASSFVSKMSHLQRRAAQLCTYVNNTALYTGKLVKRANLIFCILTNIK